MRDQFRVKCHNRATTPKFQEFLSSTANVIIDHIHEVVLLLLHVRSCAFLVTQINFTTNEPWLGDW